MESRISATRAARTFSDLMNRVRYGGEVFVVERGGVPVCRIGPARGPLRTLRELIGVLRTLPQPDAEYLDIVERVSRRQPRLPRAPWGR